MHVFLRIALAGVGALLLACGPIGPVPGGPLRGEVVSGPVEDWSFSDEHTLIAVETRPGFPHSVTTICFTHEGHLYVPARDGASKRWTRFVLADPHVRLKIGDKVYLGRAVRVDDLVADEGLIASAGRKYPRLGELSREELAGVWLFRIEPVSG